MQFYSSYKCAEISEFNLRERERERERVSLQCLAELRSCVKVEVAVLGSRP